MNQIPDYHHALEWSTLDLLEVGDTYTISTTSPFTYLVVDRARGRGGRLEIDAITLVGPGSKASKRTFWSQTQEVLIIPPSAVGQRIADAAAAFAQRDRLGSDRIELSADSYPNCLAEDIADVEDDDNAIVHADEVIV